MTNIKIDGIKFDAPKGWTVLEVAKFLGLDIPTLCYHEGLSPWGACRLCLVEVVDGQNSKLVASCIHPVIEGQEIRTATEKVIKTRKGVLELLIAQCPTSKVLQDMASKMGMNQARFVPQWDDCILCGLCTRVCDEMGFHAISSVNRGHGKEIAPPMWEPPPDCVGCLACAQVCPTDFIKYENTGDKLKIWGKEFELIIAEGNKTTKDRIEFMKTYAGPGVKPNFKIDIQEDLCRNCLRCVEECPQGLFYVSDKFNKKSFRPAKWLYSHAGDQDSRDQCAGCNVCYDVCPESAIDIFTVKKNVRILEDE